MISIAADYLILKKMTYFRLRRQSFNLIKMIHVLLISRRREVHSAGHS